MTARYRPCKPLSLIYITDACVRGHQLCSWQSKHMFSITQQTSPFRPPRYSIVTRKRYTTRLYPLILQPSARPLLLDSFASTRILLTTMLHIKTIILLLVMSAYQSWADPLAVTAPPSIIPKPNGTKGSKPIDGLDPLLGVVGGFAKLRDTLLDIGVPVLMVAMPWIGLVHWKRAAFALVSSFDRITYSGELSFATRISLCLPFHYAMYFPHL